MVIHLSQSAAQSMTRSLHAFLAMTPVRHAALRLEATPTAGRMVATSEDDQVVLPLVGRVLRSGEACIDLEAGLGLLSALDGDRSLLTVDSGMLHGSTFRAEGWAHVGAAPLRAF